MKLSSLEEYGLRCLLRIAQEGPDTSLTITRISAAEGLSAPYVAKLLRLLRKGGFVNSTRGQSGGYTLTRLPAEVVVADVLAVLGGRLVESDFCDQFSGRNEVCVRSVDCAMRSLWHAVQRAIEDLLRRVTLEDLLRSEYEKAQLVAIDIGTDRASDLTAP